MILFQAKLACILRELAKFERLTVVKPLGKTSVLRMLFEDFQYRFLDGGLPVDGMIKWQALRVACRNSSPSAKEKSRELYAWLVETYLPFPAPSCLPRVLDTSPRRSSLLQYRSYPFTGDKGSGPRAADRRGARRQGVRPGKADQGSDFRRPRRKSDPPAPEAAAARASAADLLPLRQGAGPLILPPR